MDPTKIGERLVSLRGAKSRKEVAVALGISVSALAMYERGERVPRDQVKIRIAEYYGVQLMEIFFAQDEHYKCTKEA